jgi:hypothetical protein
VWRENNKEKVRGYKLKGYEKNKELILLRNKEWRLKNSDTYKEISDIYREKIKDKVLESTKKWVNENYEKYLEKKRQYNKSEIGLEKKK